MEANISGESTKSSIKTMSTRCAANPLFAAKNKQFLEDLKKSQLPDESSSSSFSETEDDPTSQKVIDEGGPSSQSVPVKSRTNDFYCWKCHLPDASLSCDSCTRSFHPTCLSPRPQAEFTCAECTVACQPWTGSEKFATFAVYIIKNLLKSKVLQEHEVLVDIEKDQSWDYHDYIIEPMDMTKITKKNERGSYINGRAFLADIKWIIHNCVIIFGETHETTLAAKLLFDISETNIADLENCPNCYLRANLEVPKWFTRLCDKPHPIVLAKTQRSYPLWPAKLLYCDANSAKCWFFGLHDKAMVPFAHIKLLSKECLTPVRQHHRMLQDAFEELKRYLSNYEQLYGPFGFSPPDTTATLTQLLDLGSPFQDNTQLQDSNTEGPDQLSQHDPGPAEPASTTSLLEPIEDNSIAPSSSMEVRSNAQETTSIGDGNTTTSPPSSSSYTPRATAKRRATKSGPCGQTNKKCRPMPLSKKKEQAIKMSKELVVKLAKVPVKTAAQDFPPTFLASSPAQSASSSRAAHHKTRKSERNKNRISTRLIWNSSGKYFELNPFYSSKAAARKNTDVCSPVNSSSISSSSSTLSASSISDEDTKERDEFLRNIFKGSSDGSELEEKESSPDRGLRDLLNKTSDLNEEEKIPDETDLMDEVRHLLKLLKDINCRRKHQKMQYEEYLDEVRLNSEISLTEMRLFFEKKKEADIAHAKMELKRKCNIDQEVLKKKQWCGLCGNEAKFFCCWNTSYCTYECQSKHYSSHFNFCTQAVKITITPRNKGQKIAIPRISPAISKTGPVKAYLLL